VVSNYITNSLLPPMVTVFNGNFVVSRNELFAKKYFMEGCVILVDVRLIKDTYVYNEFDEVENTYWFDFKQKKFLHNIDTFYYAVKFKQDFTADSKDMKVKDFRRKFEALSREWDNQNAFNSSISFFVPGMPDALNYTPFSYAFFYNVKLECPELFDIFFAPKVPHSADNGESNTCECVVQIRSYMLWMYGVKLAYEQSYEYVKAIADYFGLEVDFVQENRVDFCWHSNYLKCPEKFFSPENFYKMRVDRFKDAVLHTSKKGSEDFEIDYLAMGKRSQKIFIRIYLKSKEVVEKGYKPWFFKVWLFNGLINRYDMYCYEYAFLKHSWKSLDLGRLQFYAEYGRQKHYVEKCRRILSQEETISPDSLRALADRLTPAVNLVMNVEYQVMRKHTKSYELIPFFDNSDKLTGKRIYDFLDNRKLICDYLTSKVFRLVEPHEPGKNDSNKSRRDLCAFWKALRSCKLTDTFIPEEDRSLVRTYTRKLNSEVVKSRAVKAAITYGIYVRGINADDPLTDCIEALCMLNDNDLHDAYNYKTKKVRQFNANELTDTMENAVKRSSNLMLIDKDTGDIIFNS
jgi:hypothetical protein